MRNLLIILFIFCFGGVMAQSKLSYKETDSLTYKYFVEKNYIELTEFSVRLAVCICMYLYVS